MKTGSKAQQVEGSTKSCNHRVTDLHQLQILITESIRAASNITTIIDLQHASESINSAINHTISA